MPYENEEKLTVKKELTVAQKVALVAAVALVGAENALALPITAPDFSGPIADMGIVFGGIVTLVVAVIGFRYVKRMFS